MALIVTDGLSYKVDYGIFAPGTFIFPDWFVHGIVTDDAQLLR